MSLRDIYGHERQREVLCTAIARQRIPHAYLFYGMDGIGKRTVALNFAKAVNCPRGRDLIDACDACPSCRKADHGNHPDIRIVKADGQFIRIKTIDDLQEQMKFRPLEGEKRVFVLDEADRMNITAAKALLKTLEEPSSSTMLILVTARPHQLPATILSRCQHIRFNPLPQETVARFLTERSALDPDRARLLSSSSGGSIVRTLEMHNEDFLAVRREVMEGIAPGWKGNPLSALAFLRLWKGERKDIAGRLEILRSCFRDALVYGETSEEEGLINRDRLDLIGRVANKLAGTDILKCLDAIDQACRALDQNANKALTLEVMTFRLAAVW